MTLLPETTTIAVSSQLKRACVTDEASLRTNWNEGEQQLMPTY